MIAGARGRMRVDSLKARLGLVVAVSVFVAAGVGATAGASGVAPYVVVPVAVALALLVTQALAAGMVAPLREMTAAARAMSRGSYDTAVSARGRGEVRELAQAFSAMAADLAAEDRQRRALVANVSHELRTPVAALHSVLENLVDGVVPADPAHLEVALGQTERLSGLVRDLLELGRLDAGLATLDRQEVPVESVLRAVVAEAGHAGGRGVSYAVEAPAGLTISADPPRLHQLLANLVDNAARHSPPGGTVTVRARGESGAVVLEVADQGPGIDPAERERVFDRFVTGSDPAAAGGGTGLGLAIARWVAVLHGGRIEAAPSSTGALLRVTLPRDARSPLPPPERTTMSSTTTTTAAPPATPPPSATRPSAPPPAPPGPIPPWWPERRPEGRPLVLGAALLVGAFAALVVPHVLPGLGTTLVLWAMAAVAVVPARRRLDVADWAGVALAGLLCATPALLDAAWVWTLCVVAAVALVTTALVGARSLAGIVLSGLAVPLAGLRGLPWLGRTLDHAIGRTSWRAVRTAVVSLVLVLVLGALLASADAVFAGWVDVLVPSVALDEPVLRGFVLLAVGGITLAGAYTALNPPALDGLDRDRAPVRHRWEWLVPVGLVDAVLALFVAAQATALFGGDAYVQRTTGLTYAEYVHQGFGQLVAVTLVVIGVVSLAARRADRTRDRAALRAGLGLLCLLTLVVVASALHRVAVYEDAYGFTRLRLLVTFFEGWLGLVVLLVMVAGVLWRARWLARAALLTGAASLLAMAAINPDAYIAAHNLTRDTAAVGDAGQGADVPLDVAYLEGLSADAVPTIRRLGGGVASTQRPACASRKGCDEPPKRPVTSQVCDDQRGTVGLEWNLGRWRAATACR